MKVIRRFLNGALLLSTPRFEDGRGSFSVPFELAAARDLGLPDFVQDNHSRSTAVGTLRGLHLQLPPHEQAKLVRVPHGRVLDVIVDLRPGSSTQGQHEVIELSDSDGIQLFVPGGFAHGFCTLEPDSELLYKVDAPYQPDAERSVAWDDRTLGIDWPFDGHALTLSDKDAVGISAETAIAEIQDALS